MRYSTLRIAGNRPFARMMTSSSVNGKHSARPCQSSGSLCKFRNQTSQAKGLTMKYTEVKLHDNYSLHFSATTSCSCAPGMMTSTVAELIPALFVAVQMYWPRSAPVTSLNSSTPYSRSCVVSVNGLSSTLF